MIYTIGHSTHKVEAFVQLLNKYNINCICDVRSVPYSRFAEQFNRENFKANLEKYNIRYLYFGKEFGARREEKDVLTDGIVDFEKVAKGKEFLDGIDRIKNGISRGYNIALMCTEKNPLECHRTILVSRNLNDIGIIVEHILPDGTSKSHKQIEQELIDKYFDNIDQISIFESKRPIDYLVEAYKKANIEIGYRKEDDD